MKLDLFDYDLPEYLIAQYPSERRDSSKLFVINRSNGDIEHKHFYDLPDYLNKGDVIVLNDSKVIHARLIGVKKETGARIELFLIRKRGQANHYTEDWEVLAKPAKRLKNGQVVVFSDDFSAEMVSRTNDGSMIARFAFKGNFDDCVDELGKMPLPPYIKRDADDTDDSRYQTVYSSVKGSLAAPTAGLHFTENLLEKIRAKGVQIVTVTLHVGLGTFRPVKVDDIEEHKMHREDYYISKESANIINMAKKEGRRVICVGTTSVRTTESAAAKNRASARQNSEDATDDISKLESDDSNRVAIGEGSTNIFIYPGYEFKIADAMITNFHLPKSTLIMLVSAFYDREKTIEAYEEAVKEEYRFFSYGDAMLLI